MALLRKWLNYLDEQVGFGVYVWGGQGEKAVAMSNPESWICKRSTSTTTANKAIKFYRKMVAEVGVAKISFFDCSGLAMYFFQNLHGITDNDTTANGLWKGCESLTRDQLRPGDFVFREEDGRMKHIGYVAADGEIIEARSSGYGVEKRPLSAGSWTHGGRHKWLKGEIEASEDASSSETQQSQGETRSVKQWQSLFLMYDPNCLPEYGADGKYGDETDAAAARLICALQTLREANTKGVEET